MKTPRRWVTILVHHDGALQDRVYKLPANVLKAAKISAGVLLVFVLLGAILYAPVALTAARVPGLNREIRRLSEDNRQVVELERILGELETRYDQVRNALGADVLADLGEPIDDRLTASGIFALHPDSNSRYETGPTEPNHWPIDSLRFSAVVTRGQVATGPEVHRGIDIAVSEGTPIRAAGGGLVVGATFDAEYGMYVLIQHPNGHETMYGHASRLLVEPGQHIEPGQIIALAGSTGRSTAPHLHFELRQEGKLIDPFQLITPES